MLAVLSFGFGEVNAQCKCATLPGSRFYSASEALKTSDIVFTGEIVEIVNESSSKEEKITFKIESVWKRDVGETLTLTTYRQSCGFFGEVGDKYLIFAYKREETFTTHMCTRTKSLDDAADDLKEFETSGEKPVKIYN